jgi:hypothetical protein
MRTTLSLDDDAYRLLKAYAKRRSVSLGEAASEVLRSELRPELKIRMVNGICTFALPSGSPKITSERVKELLEGEL